MRTLVTRGQLVKHLLFGRFNVWRFVGIITGLEKLLRECVFRLGADGVHLSQLNSERTCYIGLDITADWFKEYTINEERTGAIGLSELKNVLTLCINQMSTRIWTSVLEIEGEDGVGRVTLLDEPLLPAKTPRLKHEACIRMTGKEFRWKLRSKNLQLLFGPFRKVTVTCFNSRSPGFTFATDPQTYQSSPDKTP